MYKSELLDFYWFRMLVSILFVSKARRSIGRLKSFQIGVTRKGNKLEGKKDLKRELTPGMEKREV